MTDKEFTGASENLQNFQNNPHFIFNTLNNIYSLILTDSNKALAAVENLSTLFRYTSKNYQTGFIQLGDELEYIKSFVELEKLRLRNPENIILNIDVDPNLMITPITLIPFIENAFKHGTADDPNFPISIDIKTNNNILTLSQKNKISFKFKDKSSGISVDQVIQNLESAYENKFDLNINNDGNDYDLKLTIILE